MLIKCDKLHLFHTNMNNYLCHHTVDGLFWVDLIRRDDEYKIIS